MKEIEMNWFHQGVNLHIINFSHKHWTSRSWGALNHWLLTWKRGANQTKKREFKVDVSGAGHWGPAASFQPWLCVSQGRSLSACQSQIQCQVSCVDCFSHPLMSHQAQQLSSLWLGVPKHSCYDTILPPGRTSARWCDAWLAVAFFQPAKLIRETLWKSTWRALIDWLDHLAKRISSAIAIIVKCFRFSSNLHCCSKNSHFRG